MALSENEKEDLAQDYLREYLQDDPDFLSFTEWLYPEAETTEKEQSEIYDMFVSRLREISDVV